MAIGKLQLANSKLALIAKPKTKQGRDPKARFKDKIQRQRFKDKDWDLRNPRQTGIQAEIPG
jgi:hypothetical protein